ncbi:ZZ type zinc finger domain protein [Cordyceps militaris CM01]|uniref:ZZ type zinc finger domain protein n=1 Tax=Cordyceps militaris (strain CM01) TaxID=983644 RepID=G3J4L0_CORMM|nr:ZZ type zinc finger domain protein [Cordyceps militaris CM01]EGX95880.1 ZZ type zinc finger domain protein [Cordyceps militaris CM01]
MGLIRIGESSLSLGLLTLAGQASSEKAELVATVRTRNPSGYQVPRYGVKAAGNRPKLAAPAIGHRPNFWAKKAYKTPAPRPWPAPGRPPQLNRPPAPPSRNLSVNKLTTSRDSPSTDMSTTATGTDAMVTVKVTFDGTTRRVKMSLREMIPTVLEEHIRTFLQIPADRKAMVERYSDSAASFVLLDSSNLPVYKQLYRAAKAKSKLKLRVTVLEEPKPTPEPVTVEQSTEPVPATKPEPQQPTSPSQISLPLRTSGPSMSKQYDPVLLAKAADLVADREELRKDFESRLSCLMSRQSLNPSVLDASITPQDQPATAIYAVCCNICDRSIPDAHYHCSTCDDGDFDLCQSCIDLGITCQSDNHWLIKRSIVDGVIVKSSTEKISPKPKPQAVKEEPEITPVSFVNCVLPPSPLAAFPPPAIPATPTWAPFGPMRTCNTCLTELPDAQFLHCQKCDDFDLCQSCFSANSHGHHPMHAFGPAVPGTVMPDHINIKMAPGRNRMHMAICDGCDKNISGVRHKCLDCPDWDYCSECVESASFVHPNHRFAPLFEPLKQTHSCSAVESMHVGICCDGPLCKTSGAWPAYIRGTRYKCAICPDLDFCANCEASPANDHNQTHPLIKFKTPVRHVSVTTSGEHQDGRQLLAMGDRFEAHSQPSSSTNSVNAVQTVVDVKPEEPEEIMVKPEMKEEEPLVQLEDIPQAKEEARETNHEEELKACFVGESVADGTIYGLNHVFEQTWTLRNDGNVPWPAGCVVKFSGGDYMGHVDSTHPAGISDLVSASQSTVCYSQLAPGQEFQFTVLLRTPTRAGKFISYWRLCTDEGYRFGERLWCEVQARSVKAAPPTPVLEEEETAPEQADESQASSTMIFPKLEAESPTVSVHEEKKLTLTSRVASSIPSPVASPTTKSYLEWDGSDDGFMTDEEYDILDASDEEFLEEQHKKMMQE